MTLITNFKGNYRFLKGIAPYSCGVVAMPGHEIIRVRLQKPLPWGSETLNNIRAHLAGVNRPLEALCAMELRIPKPLSFAGFKDFNDRYQALLDHNDMLLGDINPVARTNVAPLYYQIAEPSIFAFSFTQTINDEKDGPTFVVAGAGDLVDQEDLSPKAIVRPSENSMDAHIEKVRTVMKVMQDRLLGLGVHWDAVTTTHIYSDIPLQSILEETILQPMGAAALGGVTWIYSKPPIQGLDYEMDVRGLRKNLKIGL